MSSRYRRVEEDEYERRPSSRIPGRRAGQLNSDDESQLPSRSGHRYVKNRSIREHTQVYDAIEISDDFSSDEDEVRHQRFQEKPTGRRRRDHGETTDEYERSVVVGNRANKAPPARRSSPSSTTRQRQRQTDATADRQTRRRSSTPVKRTVPVYVSDPEADSDTKEERAVAHELKRALLSLRETQRITSDLVFAAKERARIRLSQANEPITVHVMHHHNPESAKASAITGPSQSDLEVHQRAITLDPMLHQEIAREQQAVTDPQRHRVATTNARPVLAEPEPSHYVTRNVNAYMSVSERNRSASQSTQDNGPRGGSIDHAPTPNNSFVTGTVVRSSSLQQQTIVMARPVEEEERQSVAPPKSSRPPSLVSAKTYATRPPPPPGPPSRSRSASEAEIVIQ